MAGSQLIGVCGNRDVLGALLAAYQLNPDTRDEFARSGSAFMLVNDPTELRELRAQGGVFLAVLTSNAPAAAHMLSEHADRTILTREIDHARFAKVVREIIYGRPPINRNDPKQVRWL